MPVNSMPVHISCDITCTVNLCNPKIGSKIGEIKKSKVSMNCLTWEGK